MYLTLVNKTLRQQFIYRANTIFKVMGNFLKLYIQICIWKSLLQNSDMKTNVTLNEMITYVVISMVLFSFTESQVSYKIAEKVKLGTISIDLIRPISINWYTFFEQISENIFNFIFSCTPILIITYYFLGFFLPNLFFIIIFLFSILFSIILMHYINYSIGLLVFWIKDGVYTDFIIRGLFMVFSGNAIPLWFYPKFLIKVANILPFRYIIYDPILIYLEKYTYIESMNILLNQIIWIVIFLLFERLIWHLIQKSIFIQGG